MSWGAADERVPVRLVRRRRAHAPSRPSRVQSHQRVPSSLSLLACAAAKGESGATESLLRRVRELVHRYCLARIGSIPGAEHAVEDAVQDVCVNVLDLLPEYRIDRGGFEALVYTLASRRVADQQRALYRVPLPVAEIPEEVEPQPTPEEAALASEDAQLARHLLAQLPEAHRELLILRVAVGMSADEVATALDMTPGAVRVAQHRALGKLRSLVDSDGEAS